MNANWKNWLWLPMVTIMLAGTGSGLANASRRPVRARRPAVTRISSQTQRELNYAKLTIFGPHYSEENHEAGAKYLARGHYLSRKSDTDDDGFIWGVLRHTGFKTPGNLVYENNSMLKYRGFKHISRKSARPGDILVCNESDPYAAIMLQPWHGNKTMLLSMNGSPKLPNVRVRSYKFLSTGLNAKVSHLRFLRPVPVSRK